MPDKYTYPETYILYNFINDLNASNLIWQYGDTPQTMSFQGRYSLTNEADLLLLAKNCVAFNQPDKCKSRKISVHWLRSPQRSD